MYICKKCGWQGVVRGRQRCLACARKYIKEWRKNNREKSRAQHARWDKKFRLERREEYNARARRKRNPEKVYEMCKRRSKWLLSGTATRLELIEIWEKQKGLCVYCGKSAGTPRFTPHDPRGFDHVLSRAAGGKHEASNMVVCCRPCNSKKGLTDLRAALKSATGQG